MKDTCWGKWLKHIERERESIGKKNSRSHYRFDIYERRKVKKRFGRDSFIVKHRPEKVWAKLIRILK
jgi:hypothetical protein